MGQLRRCGWRSSDVWPVLVPASSLVGLHELIEFCVGGGLGGDHAVVGLGLRPYQFVKLALNDELLATLGVLDREHHHNCDGRGCRVQRNLPPRREPGHDSDDEPAGPQAGDGYSCGCLGGPVTELVEKVAAAGVVRPVQHPAVIRAAMDGAARRRGVCSPGVRRLK
jgi:hypothetical protein